MPAEGAVETPAGWVRSSLGAVGTWFSGGTPSKARADYWVGTIPWVSPKDMKRFVLDDVEDHVSDAACAAGTRLVPAGSVFIVVRGMILAHTFPVCIASRPMAFNQDVKAVVPNQTTDGRFVAHWLNGRSDALLRLVTEATHGTKRLEQSELQAFGLVLPSPPEQRQIAAILDTIDDSIRKTEEMIAKLKQVKQGLLHDLLTRGIDDNGELRDPERHPEQFKESVLGRIPREWDAGHLERWLDRPPKNGYSPKAVDEWTGRVMLGLGCLTVDGFAPLQLKNAPRNDSGLDGATLHDGDLLLTRANTRELVGLAGVYRGVLPCTYPDLMMRLSPSPASCALFLELVLRSAPLRRQIQAAAVGTSGSMVKISSAIVRKLNVAIPSVAEQARILRVATATQDQLVAETKDLDKLSMLKKGLTEDLLTACVRVTKLLESGPA